MDPDTPTALRSLLRGLPRNVVALGVVSLLADAAGDMVSPLLPLFVASLPGGGAIALGWIEGIADGLSNLLKLAAGAWTDRRGSRKPVVVLGYALAAIARPLMTLTASAWHVAAVRALDRTGKGLRTTPRDALLAAAVPAQRHGEAFGFHRAMDHAGAVVGPLVAVLLLAGWQWELRSVFWVATIPGVLSVLVALAWVREERAAGAVGSARGAPARSLLRDGLPRDFWRFLAPLAVFTLGNASDLFLLLLARDALGMEASLVALPLLWLALHAVKGVSSFQTGRLVDRAGARRVIVLGWLFYALVYALLAFLDTPAMVVALTIAYGLYHGLTEGAEKALVAELAPEHARGTAFGWYYVVVGACTLPASVAFGYLWEHFGHATPFLSSAALALAASALLFARPPRGVRASTA